MVEQIENATKKTLEAWNLIGVDNKKAESLLFDMNNIVRNIAIDAVKRSMKGCCTIDRMCAIHQDYMQRAKV